MLIDIEKLIASHHPDFLGVLMIINDRFERFPETFGDEATSEALRKEIDAMSAPPATLPTGERADAIPVMLQNSSEYGAKLASLFADRHIRPLDGISIALIGCRAWDHDTIAAARPFLPGQGLYEINKYANGLLFTDNALSYTHGNKVDYVLTGDVVNDPGNDHKTDTMLACANLLKAGGRAIHLVGQGESAAFSPAKGYIDNPLLHGFAGQQLLRNLPEGPYYSGAPGRILTGSEFADWLLRDRTLEAPHSFAMILEQQHEVALTSADAHALEARLASPDARALSQPQLGEPARNRSQTK